MFVLSSVAEARDEDEDGKVGRVWIRLEVVEMFGLSCIRVGW